MLFLAERRRPKSMTVLFFFLASEGMVITCLTFTVAVVMGAARGVDENGLLLEEAEEDDEDEEDEAEEDEEDEEEEEEEAEVAGRRRFCLNSSMAAELAFLCTFLQFFLHFKATLGKPVEGMTVSNELRKSNNTEKGK